MALLWQSPDRKQIDLVLGRCNELMEGYLTIYMRLIGHLVNAAEQVEAVVLRSTVGAPGVHGIGVAGVQGTGVGVPSAAAVAATNAGLAGL